MTLGARNNTICKGNHTSMTSTVQRKPDTTYGVFKSMTNTEKSYGHLVSYSLKMVLELATEKCNREFSPVY